MWQRIRKHSDLLFLILLMLLVMATTVLSTQSLLPIPVDPTTTFPVTWTNTATESPFTITPVEGWINSTHLYARLMLSIDANCSSKPTTQKIKVLDRYTGVVTGFEFIAMDGVDQKHLFQKVSKDWEYTLKKKDEYDCGQLGYLEILATHNATDISQPITFGISWGTNSTIVVASTSNTGSGRRIVRASDNKLYVLWSNSTNASVARSTDGGVTWTATWATVPFAQLTCPAVACTSQTQAGTD
jgi:hypothetical protein